MTPDFEDIILDFCKEKKLFGDVPTNSVRFGIRELAERLEAAVKQQTMEK